MSLFPDDTPVPRPNRAALWLAAMALLALAGYLGWTWWHRRADAEAADLGRQVDAISQRVDAIRSEQRSYGRRLQQADSLNRVLRDELNGIGQRASLLEDSVAKLADPDRFGAQALRLDETELLLTLGEQRLHIAGDLEGARRAYALASGVLAGVNDPAYLNAPGPAAGTRRPGCSGRRSARGGDGETRCVRAHGDGSRHPRSRDAGPTGPLVAACVRQSVAGAAHPKAHPLPLVILFPEIPLDQAKFLATVKARVDAHGYCTVVVSEGLHTADGNFVADQGLRDAFGHAQLGGVAPVIPNLVKSELKLKMHWAVSDYLQRSARHITARTDVQQAYALGKAAVELALKGATAVMPAIVRSSSRPYRWKIGTAPLAEVANQEHKMPRDFITDDGFGVTARGRAYLAPLVQGEEYPPYQKP